MKRFLTPGCCILVAMFVASGLLMPASGATAPSGQAGADGSGDNATTKASPVASASPRVASSAAAPTATESARQSEIDRQRAELKQKISDSDVQAKTIAGQIGLSNARRAALQKQNGDLRSKLGGQQQKLAQSESELGDARNELLTVEENLKALTARMGQMQARLEVRQRMTYKMGGFGGYLELLVSADSFRNFLTRLVFVKHVITQDKSRFTAVQQLSGRLQEAKSEVNRRSNAIAAQRFSIEAERSALATVQKQVSVTQQKVVDELSVSKGLLGQVESEKAVYVKQMQKLEAESRSIAALLKSRQRGQVFQAGGTKKLAWPTTGAVSSPFGYRIHPVFGDRRFHAGIDISAPSGQAISAAEAGTVVFAGLKGGYGNTVIVDNGNALATLYAHMSAIGVSTGQTVARGSRVGSVGCTGYCTGPHLHFETRINGEPVSPMQFF
ncbi:MAG: murein hydrolase activator EnvC family protein [Actinomycetota bacterium]